MKKELESKKSQKVVAATFIILPSQASQI